MKLGFDCVADCERVDKFRDALFGYCGVDARELLERLVGLGIALAAQYGLNAFGDYALHLSEVAVDCCAVKQKLA